ncbi:expressed unknown protein [Seminavis robusta]|uniref:Peptidylprolyl isomerase n=1 Tax=Seminavis robusta TaxID=568900 RepID=A0A9N8H3Z6_9STRA|nr:expressed unknown protein [Seminavis robusta]|eukprot:Sro2_g001740.1 n/a (464) ;mRNA; f:235985-237376
MYLIRCKRSNGVCCRSWILLLLVLCLLTVENVHGNEDTASSTTTEARVEEEVHIQTEMSDDGSSSSSTSKTASTATTTDENNSNNSNHHDCAWGTPCHQEQQEKQQHQQVDDKTTDDSTSSTTRQTDTAATDSTKAATDNTSNGSKNIPFVHHTNHHHHQPIKPPSGFAICARVYTDPHDKLAHFTDVEEGDHITLPYWECGATGSTTSPLPVKDAYFRHALSGSKPQVWSGAEYGPHPQLVVALKRMEIVLNSGETKQLTPGQVVLMEDVVSGGHKFKALEADFDMTYLVLTLPQHYHHVGKDRMALKQGTMEKKKQPPCANEQPQQQQQQHAAGGAFVPKSTPLTTLSSWETILSGHTVPDGEVAPLREGRVRKLLLGAIGVSVSSLVVDFLGKVAPLWLAVGIGGTCFVAGGTYGIVQCGDYLWTEWEMSQEKKRLLPAKEEEDEDDDEIIDVVVAETGI